MKGLLLKEWYCIQKNCRVYLLLAIACLVAAAASDNLFFTYYPCLLCGMLPVTLQSLDESSGWSRYRGTLPCTAAMLVSVKYLVCLLALAALTVTAGVAQAVKMAFNGGVQPGLFAATLALMVFLTACSVSLCLPFIFRFGVEKGRMVYYGMVVFFFAGLSAASAMLGDRPLPRLPAGVLPCLLLAAAAALFALSWWGCVRLLQKRKS